MIISQNYVKQLIEKLMHYQEEHRIKYCKKQVFL